MIVYRIIELIINKLRNIFILLNWTSNNFGSEEIINKLNENKCFVCECYSNRKTNICGLTICSWTIKFLVDHKKQYFALRCLNRSTKEIFRYTKYPLPLLHIHDQSNRSFFFENIEDLDRFIMHLVLNLI
jgi:hypothetical protein